MPTSMPYLLAIASMVLCSAALAADAPDQPPLKDLYKAHPRLFIHADQLPALRQAVKNDPLMKSWCDQLRARAEKMLDEKPIEHVLLGPRLLDKSRTAVSRVSTLGALYLIDGEKRFAQRARTEMLTAAAFKDWNPSHFLDVAEMTNALAIGYDWLYDFLSPEDRKIIRTGIIELGLKPGLQGFEKAAGWTKTTNNWSQVCNGGLTVGALAIADEEPMLAEDLVARCRAAIKPSMNAFAPDGGFAEGPGYWGYATIYTAYYLAACESALNTDWGLKQMPGFRQTGFYRMQSAGPIGRTFNYADAGEGPGTAPQMLWLARAFNQPAFAAHELKLVGDRPSIFHLLWHRPEISDGKPQIPLDAVFQGVNVAFFRSAWDDRNALFVGIKGGDNRASHSHLDLGCFVIDALAHRWAMDLGPDDYNLPGYFGKERWTYYRLRTESHNTLTLDGENQAADGKAPVIAFLSGSDRSHVVIDLSGAYRSKAGKVLRGLAVLNRSQVLVQDEIEAPQPVEVVWNFLTPSKISIDGRTATLSQDQSTLCVRILWPENAGFQIVSANPPPPQRQQPNVQNLSVRLPEKTKQARITVLLTPGNAKPAEPSLSPLQDWRKGE